MTRFGAELVEQPLRDLVGALILRDLLAHHEDALVLAHFLGHRVAQRLADGHAGQRRAVGHFRRVMGLGDVGDQVARRRLHLVRSRRASQSAARRLWRSSLGAPARSVLRLARPWRGGQRLRASSPSPASSAIGCADLHPVGAFGNQDLGDLALVDRFELHRRLVGLDLGKDVARLHLVAFLDQPFGERALFHRRRQRRHLELDRHQ